MLQMNRLGDTLQMAGILKRDVRSCFGLRKQAHRNARVCIGLGPAPRGPVPNRDVCA